MTQLIKEGELKSKVTTQRSQTWQTENNSSLEIPEVVLAQAKGWRPGARRKTLVTPFFKSASWGGSSENIWQAGSSEGQWCIRWPGAGFVPLQGTAVLISTALDTRGEHWVRWGPSDWLWLWGHDAELHSFWMLPRPCLSCEVFPKNKAVCSQGDAPALSVNAAQPPAKEYFLSGLPSHRESEPLLPHQRSSRCSPLLSNTVQYYSAISSTSPFLFPKQLLASLGACVLTMIGYFLLFKIILMCPIRFNCPFYVWSCRKFYLSILVLLFFTFYIFTLWIMCSSRAFLI
jgi:hypothetical protein